MKTMRSIENTSLFYHMGDLEKTITQAFPNLWQPVKLALGAWATGLLKGPTQHLRLNFVGKPSLGSATVLEIFEGTLEPHVSLGNIPHLDYQTWETRIAQLGNRVHFLAVDERSGTRLEERIKGQTTPSYEDRLRKCRLAVNQFLSLMRETYGEAQSMVWEHKPETLEWIHRFATLQATLREESPEAIVESLNTLGQGVAMLQGEGYGELHSLIKVTVSSMPPPFGELFDNLLSLDSDYLKQIEIERILKSFPSFNAQEIMEKLEQLSIMKYVQPDEGTSYIMLRDEWAWCHDFNVLVWYAIGNCG